MRNGDPGPIDQALNGTTVVGCTATNSVRGGRLPDVPNIATGAIDEMLCLFGLVSLLHTSVPSLGRYYLPDQGSKFRC